MAPMRRPVGVRVGDAPGRQLGSSSTRAPAARRGDQPLDRRADRLHHQAEGADVERGGRCAAPGSAAPQRLVDPGRRRRCRPGRSVAGHARLVDGRDGQGARPCRRLGHADVTPSAAEPLAQQAAEAVVGQAAEEAAGGPAGPGSARRCRDRRPAARRPARRGRPPGRSAPRRRQRSRQACATRAAPQPARAESRRRAHSVSPPAPVTRWGPGRVGRSRGLRRA